MPKTPTHTQPPALPAARRYRHALVARGYRRMTTLYVQKTGRQARQLDYYHHPDTAREVVLEIVTNDASGDELWSELWTLVSTTNRVEDTINAIP